MSSLRSTGFIIGVMLLLGLVPTCSADQYYLGAYFDGSVTTTDEVIFMCQFLDTDPLDISATGNFIGVLSVAGGDGTTVQDVMYQNAFFLYRNDELWFKPQTWEKTTQEDIDRVEIGDSDTYAMYGRTIFNTTTNEIEYYAYVYDTVTDFGLDRPTVYHYTQNREDPDVDNFIVGDETLGTWPFTKHMRYCQIGMESKYSVSSSDTLEQRHHDFGYLDGSTWKYMAARTTQGDKAYITKDSSYYYKVGGLEFEYGDIASSSNDLVEWEVTTTTSSDNASVWSSSGNVVKEALYPFNNP